MQTTKYRHGHRWTDGEISTLMRMWDQEMSRDAIASAIGVTVAAISHMVVRLRQQGVPLSRRKKGHQYGVNNGKLWSQSEVDFLIRRRFECATAEHIGHELDRTPQAVHAMIANLRRSGVPIPMLGNGVRRLWDPEASKAVFLASKPGQVSVVREDEGYVS